MKEKVKQTEKDRFIQIAAGGKNMNGEIKRMAEIPPKAINRNVLKMQNTQLGVTVSAFNEENAYQSFLTEKAALREYYAPFLKNYARKVGDGWLEITARKRTRIRRIFRAY